MTRTKSAASKQSSRTVPLPIPIAADKPTPLDSWHILLQSGRLFVPICRAKVPQRNAASFEALPDVYSTASPASSRLDAAVEMIENASSQLSCSYRSEPSRSTIGCVSRPNLSSSMSEKLDHSCTVLEPNIFGVNRFLVASMAKALAPFSQNSNRERWSSGSGHAHPGQSYPSKRFTVRMVFMVRAMPASANPMRNDFVTP